jgi:hypothetical protein
LNREPALQLSYSRPYITKSYITEYTLIYEDQQHQLRQVQHHEHLPGAQVYTSVYEY